jgi:arylsulfatase A-like enzyme
VKAKMNVIFVISDTFRRDNLSCYGPTQVKTPVLDRFAQESYVFENCTCGSFPTIPCRLDFMSGRYSFVDHEWCPLPVDTLTLQQVLSASGVLTQMIVDNPHLIEMGFNYERGFDGWEWIRGQETDAWKSAPRDIPISVPPEKTREHILRVHMRNTAWWQSEEDRFASRTIQAACDWLEENQDEGQFFLYLDLFDPHEPWDPPKKYIEMYEQDYNGHNIIYPAYGAWQEFLSEDELNHIRALYMAETSLVDHWFGVLLDKIDELGLTEDTGVIFVSDHGLLFGEHGLLGKAFRPQVDGAAYFEAMPMYADIREVPLLIRLPGQAEGRRISSLVQIPDLMPTVLEMAGLVATETIGGRSHTQALQCGVFYTEDWQFKPEAIHGRSLMPLLRGETDRHRDIAVASQTLIYPSPILSKSAIVTEDGWCLHYAGAYDDGVDSVDVSRGADSYKLINPEGAKFPVEPALFYLPDDPEELEDVIDSNQALALEIHERYVSWLEEAGTPDVYLAGRHKLR